MAYDEESFLNVFQTIVKSNQEYLNCGLPCKVRTVKGNFVDVELVINDENDEKTIIPNVPIKREETARAYVFLGIKAGDYGTVRFNDRSMDDYKLTGEDNFNGDTRCHDLNDGVFELGFIPSASAYVYPDNTDIEIGLKDGSAIINISGSNISITGGNITISGSNVTIGGNTTIDGKVFLEHQHSNGNNGANTGGVV